MDIRWIGAALVVGSCAAAGFHMAAQHRWETSLLKQLLTIMDYMECELQYRRTPLPELCMTAAGKATGILGEVLRALSKSLESCISPSAEQCMRAVLACFDRLPATAKEILLLFGNSLGEFDLEGQINGLKAVKLECHRQLDARRNNQEERIRSYQTLGVCAGAGLAILFI